MNKKFLVLDLIFWCSIIFNICLCVLWFEEEPLIYSIILLAVILIVIFKVWFDRKMKKAIKFLEDAKKQLDDIRKQLESMEETEHETKE